MSVILMAAQRIADTVPFIFFDGRTFSRTRHIEEVVRAATEADADYRILHLSAPTSWHWSVFDRVKAITSRRIGMQLSTGQ